MQVQRPAAGTSVIQVNGELVSDGTAAMRRAVADELLSSPGLLALDLSGVNRIDGDGIDALTSAATQAGESDIGLCLVGAHKGPSAAALAAADLSELVEIVPTLDDI
ncbi:STAS domain-containing protein [Mycobacterium celatum]|uniref:STAS domain-containing protein n=1 Tax=Mycobacterium celatum TaxID=28045 RepID=UPI003083E9BC